MLQAEIEIPGDRDPVAMLEEQAVTRVPELVPIRYGRMLASAFAFYRGGALIMATDLSRTPRRDTPSSRASHAPRHPDRHVMTTSPKQRNADHCRAGLSARIASPRLNRPADAGSRSSAVAATPLPALQSIARTSSPRSSAVPPGRIAAGVTAKTP
jgi:hypothetical protein